ncbi:hypothetical protein OG259_00275 [Streptomyces sp. NBC_00250]|uniref:hypothetical protein n=1 Tax=Streptomyces sp. NBC_00250 TaxID=2903641 RepID=UPI002E2AB362|nr:hypothetical protein [Streptomyces sp. NBC_00250]
MDRLGPAGQATEGFGIRRATLSLGGITLTMRPLEGSLPKYRSLFPQTSATSARLDRATTVRAVKKCQAIQRAKWLKDVPVAFVWDTGGHIPFAPRLETAEGDARTKGMPVPTTVTNGSGERLYGGLAAFNPYYLLDGDQHLHQRHHHPAPGRDEGRAPQ